MECNSQYSLSTGRRWLRLAGAVFRHGHISIGGLVQRFTKAGICPAPFYPLCSGKDGCRLWHGDYDSNIQYLRRYRSYSNERHGNGGHSDRHSPLRDRQRHLGRGIYGEYPFMACIVSWEPFHNGHVLYSHTDCLRQIL